MNLLARVLAELSPAAVTFNICWLFRYDTRQMPHLTGRRADYEEHASGAPHHLPREESPSEIPPPRAHKRGGPPHQVRFPTSVRPDGTLDSQGRLACAVPLDEASSILTSFQWLHPHFMTCK